MKDILRDSLSSAMGSILAFVVTSILAFIFKDLLNQIWFMILFTGIIVWLILLLLTNVRDKPKVILHAKSVGRNPPKGPYKFPRLRPWSKAGTILIPILLLGGISLQLFIRQLPPNNILILIADFKGPEPDKYHLTDSIYEKLNLSLSDNDEYSVKRIDRTITQSSEAREEGERQKAAIVIWGWYGDTEVSSLSVHFEIMNYFIQLNNLCPAAKGEIRTLAKEELESFSLQTDLSNEITYLTYFVGGMAHYLSEDWIEAISDFNNALAYANKYIISWPETNTYYYRGRSYMELEDYKNAKDDFDQAINLDPDYAGPFYERALVNEKLKDWDAAIEDYSQVIQLDPTDVEAITYRGDVHYWQKEYESAIADYNLALKINPDVPCTVFARGKTYIDNEEYDLALNDFQSLLENDSKDADAYYGIGRVMYEQQNYSEAIKNFDKSISLSEEDNYDAPDAYEYRGYSFSAVGEKKRAIEDLRIALEQTEDEDQRLGMQEKLINLVGDQSQ